MSPVVSVAVCVCGDSSVRVYGASALFAYTDCACIYTTKTLEEETTKATPRRASERASASALHESSARAVRTLVSRRVLSNHELRGLRPSRGSARAKHLNLLL